MQCPIDLVKGIEAYELVERKSSLGMKLDEVGDEHVRRRVALHNAHYAFARGHKAARVESSQRCNAAGNETASPAHAKGFHGLREDSRDTSGIERVVNATAAHDLLD